MTTINRKSVMGAALAAILMMVVVAPAMADDWHGRGPHDRDWAAHERYAHRWHAHPMPAPVVYAPPAVVYAPPPPPPSAGINLVIPFNIR